METMKGAWVASPDGRVAAGGEGQSPARVIVLYKIIRKAQDKARPKFV